MPYEFSPDERLMNICYVLDQLQDRLHDAMDEFQRDVYRMAISRALASLNDAVLDMKPKEPK